MKLMKGDTQPLSYNLIFMFIFRCVILYFQTLLDSLYKLHIGKNSSYFQRLALKALNIIFKTHNVHLFQPLTVDEILWGYNDTFLEYLQQEEEKYGWILKALGWNLPPIPTTFIALQVRVEMHFVPFLISLLFSVVVFTQRDGFSNL